MDEKERIASGIPGGGCGENESSHCPAQMSVCGIELLVGK